MTNTRVTRPLRRQFSLRLVPLVALVLPACTWLFPERPSRSCVSDEACAAADPLLPFCGDERACVECRVDAHCSAPSLPVCSQGSCAPGCRADQDCGPEQPHCSPEGRCAECLEGSHCPAGEACREGLCVPGCDVASDCSEGEVCAAGRCVVPRPEACNGLDDDFDEEVDEGFDLDGDGFSSCALVSDPPDCNDAAAEAHPGAAEVCDRLDNNCDGEINEGFLCPEGETCDGALAECVPIECAVDLDCDDPLLQFCHLDGLCYPRSVAFGQPCVLEDQCAGVLQCIDTSPLGYPGRHCTRTCCGSPSCPESGSWCADNGSGLKVCAPAAWFGGTRMTCGASSCSACWSYLGIAFECATQCCRDADCSAGSCQLVPGWTLATGGASPRLFLCDVFTGSGIYEEIDCGLMHIDECRSGLSWPLGGDRCVCTSPCCSSSDCALAGHPDARCVLVAGFLGCYDPAILGPLGTGGSGAPCDPARGLESCASGVCHPDGYCTEVCCPGGGCAEPGHSCRPVATASGRVAVLCSRD